MTNNIYHHEIIIAGSGQSPNSTHPGSPPAITAPPPSLLNNKRPGYYQGNDGLPTKRPRISHYKKSEQNSGSSITGENGRTAGSGNSNNSVSVVSGAGSTSANGGSSSNSGGVVDGWDQRQHQRDIRRGDYRPERTANSDVLRSTSYSTGKPCLTPTSDSEEINQTGHGIITSTGSSGNNTANNSATGHNSHSVAHSNSLSGNRHHTGKTAILATDGNSGTDYVARLMPSVVSDGGSASNFSGSSNGILADRRDRSDRNDRSRASERDRDSRKKSNGTGGNSYNDLSASNYTATEDNTVSTSSCALELPESPKSSEYPDYLT